jgi:hypothetical protein
MDTSSTPTKKKIEKKCTIASLFIDRQDLKELLEKFIEKSSKLQPVYPSNFFEVSYLNDDYTEGTCETSCVEDITPLKSIRSIIASNKDFGQKNNYFEFKIYFGTPKKFGEKSYYKVAGSDDVWVNGILTWQNTFFKNKRRNIFLRIRSWVCRSSLFWIFTTLCLVSVTIFLISRLSTLHSMVIAIVINFFFLIICQLLLELSEHIFPCIDYSENPNQIRSSIKIGWKIICGFAVILTILGFFYMLKS